MVSRGAGERPYISEQMVYQCITAQFGDFGGNSQKPQCGCEGFALVNKRAINKQQNHETTNQHRRTS